MAEGMVTRYNVETYIDESIPEFGVMVPLPLPAIADWSGTLGLFGNANPPANSEGIGEVSGAGHTYYIGWQGTADDTKTIGTGIVLDDRFCTNLRRFVWPFYVRKLDQTGSATDTTDLNLQCLVQALVPGDTTYRTIIAAASNTFAVPAKTTSLTFSEWRMDLGALLTATTKEYLKVGTVLSFEFSPSKAVGTNLMVQMIPRPPLCGMHLSTADRSVRKGRYQ